MKQPESHTTLYRIDRCVRSVLHGVTVVLFVLLILATLNTPWKRTIACIFFAVGSVWAVLILCRLCLSPFVKSDEQEQMEEQVEYIIRKHHAAETQALIEDYSPLRELPPDQQQRVKQLLRDLPPHPDKPGHINLAAVAQHLTALQQAGKADITDKHNLRLWVAKVTGRQVPPPGQFNEALPSTNKRKVAAAKKSIEQAIL